MRSQENIEYFLKTDQAPNVKFIDLANPEDRDRIVNCRPPLGSEISHLRQSQHIEFITPR